MYSPHIGHRQHDDITAGLLPPVPTRGSGVCAGAGTLLVLLVLLVLLGLLGPGVQGVDGCIRRQV